MNTISKLTPALLSLSLGAACAPKTIAIAPEASNTLTVTGEGEANAAPDLATVRLGVEERATTADGAMKQANRRMQEIIAALKAKGVSENDLQTTDLSMYFERNHEPRPVSVSTPPSTNASSEEGEVKARKLESEEKSLVPEGHYVVRNTVIVSVRDLKKIGDVIGAAMQAGANHLHGFELSIEDPTLVQEKARDEAIEHAIDKAEKMAKRANVELGPIKEITETGSSHPVPMAANRKMVMAESSVPVEQGQMSVSQGVQIVFALIPRAEN